MYQLRTALVGHSGDVRAVVAGISPEGSVITCSRDETTKLWTPSSEEAAGLTCAATLRGHTKYVICACVVPPSDEFPRGLVVTGGNDHNILVFTPPEPGADPAQCSRVEPLFTLTGHTDTVSALAAGKFGTLVSGSWDCSARVWLGQKCVLQLTGHAAAIWAVAVLPGSGLFLTGSADKTIRAWRTGKCVRTFTGHTDCVRGLALLSEAEFLSCGNDASIRHWNIEGDCLRTLYGHTNFVYSIAVLPNGSDFVSSGEDRTVRVWRGGELTQTLSLPCQSVWAVASLQNGDIAAATSDGVCRLFTTAPERQASPEARAAYEAELAGTQMSKADLGGYKVSDLPGPEVLLAPGRRDGQTVMVRELDGSVTCHAWSAGEMRWSKVGEVVGATGGSNDSSGKVLHEGKEYDYVFTVDIEEGAPPLKLPYNLSEDPWQAAQRFIHRHDLSQNYLDTVANFIVKNSSGGGAAGAGVPENPTAASAEYCDPFTGGGRYVPGSAGGGGATGTPAAPPPADPSAPAYFPQLEYVLFDRGNVDGMAAKLREFSQRVAAAQRPDAATIEQLVQLVEPGTQPSAEQLDALTQLLDWPDDLVFPCIDLLRLAVRGAWVCERLCAEEPRRHQLLAALQRFAAPRAPATNQLLAVRATCNLLGRAAGRRAVLGAREQLCAAALQLLDGGGAGKQLQVAVATLLLDMAVCVRSDADGGGAEAALHAMSALCTALAQLHDGEALFRALVGLGTLLSGGAAAGAEQLRQLARSLDVPQLLQRLAQVPEPAKVAACAGQLRRCLGAC